MDLNANLAGHWKLAGDTQDHSGNGNHGTNHGANLKADGPGGATSGAAAFNGQGAYIEIPHHDALALGNKDFSLSAWVHTSEALDDILGDIASKFDPQTRTGFNFGILNNAGVTAAQSNFRHVHFGIDSGGIDSGWIDAGRPGNNLRVYSLAVFEGDLYAGTFETGADETGHVYRYDGNTGWIDCGGPDKCNTMASLCVYNGKLYAGSSRYKPGGSALPDSENLNPGGNMYRYEGGTNWTHIGHLEGADSVAGMAVYKNELYAIPLYSQGIFRYDGDQTWISCGTPGRRLMSLAVFNGHLYGAGNEGKEEGGIFRYEGGTNWSHAGGQQNVTQVYSFAAHEGKLYTGTWPEGKVFRDDGNPMWTDVGRLGDELEVMAMPVYNGKLYAGTLPLGQVYRYESDGNWALTGQLDKTPDVKYRRIWSMAIYNGKLYAGTLPSGHVYALESGKNVTHDRELTPGWHHLTAVRKNNRLHLYVDNKEVTASSEFDASQFNLTNTCPLRIGAGAQDFFNGRLADLRLYSRALSPEEITALQSSI